MREIIELKSEYGEIYLKIDVFQVLSDFSKVYFFINLKNLLDVWKLYSQIPVKPRFLQNP